MAGWCGAVWCGMVYGGGSLVCARRVEGRGRRAESGEQREQREDEVVAASGQRERQRHTGSQKGWH